MDSQTHRRTDNVRITPQPKQKTDPNACFDCWHNKRLVGRPLISSLLTFESNSWYFKCHRRTPTDCCSRCQRELSAHGSIEQAPALPESSRILSIPSFYVQSESDRLILHMHTHIF